MKNLDLFLSARKSPYVTADKRVNYSLYERQLFSQDNLNWYNEQLEYCEKGRVINGERVTGDHYWFLNFFPIMRFINLKGGGSERKLFFPRWCQPDDYLFKQIEEAAQDNLGVIVMTGRGQGKTFLMLSIAGKIYTTIPESLSIVSANDKVAVDESFNKLVMSINAIGEFHPTLRHKRLKDSTNEIKSGEEIFTEGEKTDKRIEGYQSVVQKILYNEPGKTKGKRVHYQLWEEIGEWDRPPLADCIGASEGTYYVGGKKLGRDFYIGTGGSVKSDYAKELFLNPDAFRLYKTTDYSDRPTGIFIPCYKKAEGFYDKEGPIIIDGKNYGIVEKVGYNNDEAARKYYENRREELKDYPAKLEQFMQEFPFTVDEIFRKRGGNSFNMSLLSGQLADIEIRKKHPEPERGFLRPIKNETGDIVSVEFVAHANGNVEIVEHPEEGYDNLYIAGLDSIDQGNDDSAENKGDKGSKLSMLVKKRMTKIQNTGDLYVAKLTTRSNDVRDDWMSALLLVLYYNCNVNIEYTKISIISFFEKYGQRHRFVNRPVVATATLNFKKKSEYIGTPATPKVIAHQDKLIAQYILDDCHKIYFTSLLKQLIDYEPDNRTKYDEVVAMGLCEIADEDITNITPTKIEKVEKKVDLFGYYTDSNGIKRKGNLSNAPKFNTQPRRHASYYDVETSKWVYE